MFKYSVKPGDTLYSIARRFSISINEILVANLQINNPALIFPGMVINVPYTGSIVYTIQPYDTLYLISNKFGVTLSSLVQANPGINPSKLLIGMQIFIPISPINVFPTYNIVGISDKLTQVQKNNITSWRDFIVQFAKNHPNEVYIHGPNFRNAVALTFDDGPNLTITPSVLDILKQYNVKAGFFFLGSNVNLYPQIVRRAYSEGNLILNHSWNHPNFTNEDLTSVRDQIIMTEESIRRIIGVRPTFVRPPYGAINERVLPVITDTNNKAVIWSIDSMDWVQNVDKNTIVKNILDNVRPGDIVLLHSYPNLNETLEALPEIIIGLRARGYNILNPAELLGINPYKL
ncbi:MAG: peptidoglycan/xylan/chitin deacetylase (PgdA/CDA1 family)/LysM repeat protein [Clostridium sp.]|jgi:peptidoglycan/xylan/chitin deacetylase (PgdA/CDA1 family)/LysM repeat protein